MLITPELLSLRLGNIILNNLKIIKIMLGPIFEINSMISLKIFIIKFKEKLNSLTKRPDKMTKYRLPNLQMN